MSVPKKKKKHRSERIWCRAYLRGGDDRVEGSVVVMVIILVRLMEEGWMGGRK